jgi:diacylglycerol kinase
MKIMKAGEKDEQIKKFNINERLNSFKNAFRGMITLLRREHNARIHLLILLVVLASGILLRISSSDWIAIFLPQDWFLSVNASILQSNIYLM